MRVKDCKTCKYFKRRVWIQSYKPNNFHQIGITHAYAYCEKYKTRCLNLKHCDFENQYFKE